MQRWHICHCRHHRRCICIGVEGHLFAQCSKGLPGWCTGGLALQFLQQFLQQLLHSRPSETAIPCPPPTTPLHPPPACLTPRRAGAAERGTAPAACVGSGLSPCAAPSMARCTTTTTTRPGTSVQVEASRLQCWRATAAADSAGDRPPRRAARQSKSQPQAATRGNPITASV